MSLNLFYILSFCVVLYGSICVANFNFQCNMQNGNSIFIMATQYSKWQCISVFKLTFSITPHVQSLVQKENENEIILFTYFSLNM